MLNIEKKTGIFWGIVFLLASLYNLLTNLINSSSTDLITTSVTVGCAVLFFVAAFIKSLRYVQAIMLLLLSAIPIAQTPTSFYGVAFYVCGVVMLFLFQFFKKHGLTKLIVVIAYFYALEIFGFSSHKGMPFIEAISAVIFITAFFVFLYITFQEKILIYLKPTKPVLRLSEKGLSQTEINYVMALLGGQTAKEIAFDREVAESTVRNTLSRAYRKLEVQDRLGLAALNDKFRIIL